MSPWKAGLELGQGHRDGNKPFCRAWLLGGEGLVCSSHGVVLPEFDHSVCRTLYKSWAGEGLLLGTGWKSSLSCWDGLCVCPGDIWSVMVVAEGDRYQRSGWEAERSCGDTGWEGMWCRRAELEEEEG